MTGLIRATNLRGYPELVTTLGAQPGPFLSRFHLAIGIERQTDAFISFSAAADLLAASAEELACPDFGLQLSQWQGLDILGPLAVIARNADTVQDSLVAIARYLYLHSPALAMAIAPSPLPDSLRFTFQISELSLDKLRQAYELSLANAARIVRLLSGGSDGVSGISFLHRQLGPDTSYAATLGCPVRFEQDWCGFELPRRLAAKRIDSADPETRRIAIKYLAAEFPEPGEHLPGRVAELARRLLRTGQCSAETIADLLSVHPRTLQRRLAAEGAVCQNLIDEQRKDLAERYLAEFGLSLNQVARLVGYTEQSSLNRSCGRWFDQTPRQYRAQIRAPKSTPET